MRKTPIYLLDCDVSLWLSNNEDSVFNEVLESTEAAAGGEYNLTEIPVIILQTENGTTLFALKSIESTKESIEKAMNHFVKIEDYEKAARARDVKLLICTKTEKDI